MSAITNLTVKFLKLESDFQEFQTRNTENMDAFFVVIVSVIIYLMQCGFAFIEAGSVRSKNTVNILIKNLLDTYVSGLSYWLVGYAFAFGEDGNSFISYSYFAHAWMHPKYILKWLFHFVFAATAATIVSGAVAERCAFNAYLVYSFCLTAFVYPVVTHWAWDPRGWLAVGITTNIDGVTHSVIYQDFAGSGVVHVVGGVVAFVGALMLGPRIGRFVDGRPQEIRGHSIPLASLGGFILCFGFFAFNGGSQAEISSKGAGVAVARSIVNTVLAATGGSFTTLLLNKSGLFGDAKWSLLTTLNGCLTGMVSICAGCNAVYSYGAFATGIIGGVAYMCFTWIVLKFKVDDPVDAVAVHFGGGVVGVISVPFFDFNHGIFYNGSQGSGLHLAWNLVGLITIIAWSTVFGVIIFGSLKLTNMLRVSKEYEIKGLDIIKHGEEAYPPESYGHGWGAKGEQVGKLLRNMIPGITGDLRKRKTTVYVEDMTLGVSQNSDVIINVETASSSTHM